MKFCGEVERGPVKSWLDFGGNSDSFMDPGSFSRILCHQQRRHKLTFFSVSQQDTNGFL